MESFSYVNIFETKGIEYIIIIIFLLFLIPFWMIFNKRVPERLHNAVRNLTASVLRIPQGLFFSKNHTWAFLEKSGNAKIGIDDFLLQVVGHVKVEQFKAPGEQFNKGDLLAEINGNGKKLKVFAPVSGEVVHSNKLILNEPSILNEDPYERGWFYSVKPTNWKGETAGYFMAEEATTWINRELQRLKDFLAVSVGKYSDGQLQVAFQEGGELMSSPLAGLQPEIWDDFQKEFLD